jgi:hypothetical protein
MQPGNNKVFFNPIYTLSHIQSVADKIKKEQGIENNFQLDVRHLSAIVLHEINHMKNHTELKLSTKMITEDGKTMNILEYQKTMYDKYGSEFQRFENILEDIDVNNHATKLQATVFESSKQDIYRHISAPSEDFSQEPLTEQFAWTCLRESMIDEPCIVDPIVRSCVGYLNNS